MIDQPPPELRRIQILAHVRRNGGASISQLAREYSISPVTVHRDLEVLATEGLITRIRGGPRAPQGGPPGRGAGPPRRVPPNPAGEAGDAAPAARRKAPAPARSIQHPPPTP